MIDAPCYDGRRRGTSEPRRVSMRITQRVKKILDWYESDNPGSKAHQ